MWGRCSSALVREGYSSQVSERAYTMLAEQARVAVRGGHSVIENAVYARPADRLVIERAAADASVPFVGLWLDAPESTLIARIDQRRNDPSDADAGVIRCSARNRQEPSGGIVSTPLCQLSSCCRLRPPTGRIRSFRALSASEAENIRPHRIDLYIVRAGDTWDSLAERSGAPSRPERLRL
jgi:hypothetical protein